MADDSKQQKSLRDRLRSLLVAEFEGLDPGNVAGVLNGMASELVQMSEAGVQRISEIESEVGGWSEELARAGESAFPMQTSDRSSDRPDIYEIDATEVERVEHLLEQVLGLGAVVFALDEQPPLNEEVEVRLSIPTFHLTIESAGRVVHHSDKGTAIELSGLSREDRAALEAIQADLRAGEEDDDSDTPAVSRPTLDLDNPADESSGPWDSFPIPSLSRRPERSFRRQVSLTDPDQRVLTSTQSRPIGARTRELYGPGPPWFDIDEEPDRVERLAEDRVIDILLQVSQSNLSGMLEVEADKQTFQVLLDKGLICEIAQRPRIADEELGVMLYRAERITKQQLSMASAHADESGETIARSLLELGILEPDPIRKSIAGRLMYLLQRIVELTSGEIRVYVGSAMPTGFLPNPPLRVHIAAERVVFRKLFDRLKGMTHRARDDSQSEALEAYPEIIFEERDRMLRALTSDEHVDLADTLLKGRKRLKEVFTESGLSHAETFAVVHALHRMGLVRFDRSLHHTIVRERFRENVTVKYLSVHKASYFEVLNVHWSSYSAVIKTAYEELIEQFAPEDVPEELEDEVHKRVGEIRDRIESAYQVLAERETRHAYRKRIMPEYKLAHAIPLFLKQAELAERRRQWTEAKDAILRVLEIEPDHSSATYRLDRLEAILDNRLSPEAADSNF